MGYPSDPATLGEHLRVRRLSLGLRQKDVAARLGIAWNTLLEWEKDRVAPEVRYWPELLAFLGYDPRPEPQRLGDRIKARREALGLSLELAAQQIGVDEGTLARWEKGVWRPSGTRRALVEAFLGGGSPKLVGADQRPKTTEN